MAAVNDLESHTETPPHRRWLQRLLWIAAVLLVIGGLIGAIRWKIGARAQRDLDAIVAELDDTDPHWRIEDIEANRKEIPDAENTALIIMQIETDLRANPKRVSPQEKTLYERMNETPPDVQIEPQLRADLRVELDRIAPQVKQALSLASMKNGRYPLSISKDYISTRLACQAPREVLALLQQEIAIRLREGNMEGACAAARAMFAATRSIGDEPTMVSQLVRMAGEGITVRSLERILAQGEPTEASLAALQTALEDELAVPILVHAIRAERGGQHVLFGAIEDGSVNLAQLGGTQQGQGTLENLSDSFTRLASGASMRRAHVVNLKYLNEALEAAKLPPEQFAQRLPALSKVEKDPDLPRLSRLLIPAVSKICESYHRTRASLHTAIVAVAAERFRIARGRWPKDLAELTPAFIKEVPLDPYDGKPLRLRAVEDGLRIYSIGKDLKDNGGEVDPKWPNKVGSNIVFQLWNVDERRKPAVNPDVGPPRPTEEDLQNLMMQEWMPPVEAPKAP